VNEQKKKELILEDWRDFVSAFYFPKLVKKISNQKIINFISATNNELLDSEQ